MLQLPDEILLKIMGYVPPKDKFQVAQTCSRLRAAVNTELTSQAYLHQPSTRTK